MQYAILCSAYHKYFSLSIFRISFSNKEKPGYDILLNTMIPGMIQYFFFLFLFLSSHL